MIVENIESNYRWLRMRLDALSLEICSGEKLYFAMLYLLSNNTTTNNKRSITLTTAKGEHFTAKIHTNRSSGAMKKGVVREACC